jgi:hydrogenase nickel incorporation protein HypA/HybF
MHELSITRAIIAIVLQKAEEVRARKITRIDLQIGRLAGVNPECVQLQFEILSRDTAASGATLSIHQPPAKLRCRKCDIIYSKDDFNFVCPQCQEREFEILSGSELRVEDMEVE